MLEVSKSPERLYMATTTVERQGDTKQSMRRVALSWLRVRVDANEARESSRYI